jgi:hypothetical protein
MSLLENVKLAAMSNLLPEKSYRRTDKDKEFLKTLTLFKRWNQALLPSCMRDIFAFTFNELRPLCFSHSELTSGTVNPFRHFGKTVWTEGRPIARALLTQDRKIQ